MASGFHAAGVALLAAGLSVDVFVRDGAGVPAAVLADARTAAARVFQQAGVAIVWLDATGARGRSDFYTVRLERGSGRALGSAAVGTRVARVFPNRVAQVATAAGSDAALVLGHAIAHELGHLLLRRTAHTARGLMQFQMDVGLAAKGRLLFTEEEARTLRARVSAANEPRRDTEVAPF